MKKPQRKLQKLKVIDREFEQAIHLMADEQLAEEKEHYNSNMESWEHYADRKRQVIHDDMTQNCDQFNHGFEVIVNEITRSRKKKSPKNKGVIRP